MCFKLNIFLEFKFHNSKSTFLSFGTSKTVPSSGCFSFLFSFHFYGLNSKINKFSELLFTVLKVATH